MAERRVPGVYIEEVASSAAIPSAVSASVAAFLGFTARGPMEATLFTSFAEFDRLFGGIVADSLVGHSVAAFFANGGARAYMGRVVPADAVAAAVEVRAQHTMQVIETGEDDVGPYAKTADTTELLVAGGDSPIVADSLTLSWRAAAAAGVSAERLYNRTGGAVVPIASGTAVYEGMFNPASVSSLIATGFDCIVPGSVTFEWQPTADPALTYNLTATPVNGIATGTNGAGSVFTVDYRTSRWSIRFVGADIPAGGTVATSLTVDYTPTTTTYTATSSSGTLSGSGVSAGSVTEATGAYTLTTTSPATPYDGSPIYATYQTRLATAAAKSKGAWGGSLDANGTLRGLALILSGDPSAFVAATGLYTRWRASLSLFNAATGRDEVVESYDDLVLDDDTHAQWWLDAINDLSDYVVFGDAYGVVAPPQLQAVSNVFSIAGGDGSAGGRTITMTLPSGARRIAPRSVTIRYTDTAGVARTITDGGAGSLSGSIDATYATAYASTAANTIGYTSGVVNVRTGVAIRGGSLVTITYATLPASATLTEAFGDAAKDYTVGDDGTFDGTNYGRDQFTSPSLADTNEGIYVFDAGDPQDEILNVVVPDFMGDATVSADLVTYAETRAGRAAGADRFMLLSPPSGYTSARAADWVRNVLGSTTRFAAVYWPWLKVPDVTNPRRSVLCPPAGHVAGIYARVDTQRNPSRAPAGTELGALRYVSAFERVPSDTDLEVAFANKINALRSSRQTGRCVWGARTLSDDRDFKYIQAVRTAMFVERSIYLSTWWTVFEDTGPALWTKIRLQLQSFLGGLFREGYFPGTTESQAFEVLVDGTNNPGDLQESGQTLIDVGLAYRKPSEFVRFRFSPRRVAA